MPIKEQLEKKGYDVDSIYDLAEQLVDNMLEKQPLPEGLTPKQYMVMASAVTASSILSQIKPEGLEDEQNSA